MYSNVKIYDNRQLCHVKYIPCETLHTFKEKSSGQEQEVYRVYQMLNVEEEKIGAKVRYTRIMQKISAFNRHESQKIFSLSLSNKRKFYKPGKD